MNQDQFFKNGISQISAGRRIPKGRQVLYKSRKKFPSPKIQINEGYKSRPIEEEGVKGKKEKNIEGKSSINITI